MDVRIIALARAIHPLGPRPLAELLAELDRGANLRDCLEAYAALAPRTGFIRDLDGDRLPPLHAIRGGVR